MTSAMQQVLKYLRLPQNIISVIGLVITMPLLATFAIKGFYVRYIADDFCTAASLVDYGWWNAQLHWYNSWSGRFSFTAVVTAFELLGVQIALWMPALLIVMWLVVLTWSISLLIGRLGIAISHLTSLLLATLVVSAYIITNPHTGQAFYWFTGSITYTLPLIFLTAASGLAIKSLDAFEQINEGFLSKLKSRQAASVWGAGVLIFIAASLNETYAVLQLSLLFLLVGALIIQNISKRQALLKYMVISGFWMTLSLISTLIMYIAPGNAVREAAFPDNPSLSETLEFGLTATNSYLIYKWQYAVFIYLFIIAVSLLIISGVHKQKNKLSDISLASIINQSVVIVAIAYLLSVLVQLPSYYVQHYPTTERSLASIPFTFAIAAILLAYQAYRAYLVIGLNKVRYINAMVFVIVLVAMYQFLSSQTIYFVDELRTKLPALQQYADSWDKQNDKLKQLSDERAALVKVSRLGNTFDLEDTSTDAKHWINGCMAGFYSVGVIVAE